MRTVAVLAVLGACSFRAGVAQSPPVPGGDASSDTTVIDTPAIDARPIDARPIDARPIDARPIDARPIDAPPDARPIDAPPDARMCPAGYAAISGGPLTSKYKLFNYSSSPGQDSSATWTTAVSTCQTDGTHLVIVNDANEDAALRAAITTDPALPYFWIGITDAVTEGTWLTVQGAPAPYLPWAVGQPNGGTLQNWACEASFDGTFFDYYATQPFAYACECD